MSVRCDTLVPGTASGAVFKMMTESDILVVNDQSDEAFSACRYAVISNSMTRT